MLLLTGLPFITGEEDCGNCSVPKLGDAKGDWDCGKGESRCRLGGGGMPVPFIGDAAPGDGDDTGGEKAWEEN